MDILGKLRNDKRTDHNHKNLAAAVSEPLPWYMTVVDGYSPSRKYATKIMYDQYQTDPWTLENKKMVLFKTNKNCSLPDSRVCHRSRSRVGSKYPKLPSFLEF